MRITTWNVNGIRARYGQVVDWVAQQERPDVVCLQELKAAAAEVPGTLFDLGDYWWYWHGNKGYSGVALGVKKSFAGTAPAFFHPAFDRESRIVACKLGPITVASIYVPNGGKDLPAKLAFLEAIDGFAQQADALGEQLVLCGDLNVALTDQDVHVTERRADAIGQLPEERRLLSRVLGRGLVDLGRTLDPDNDALFTWWAPWRNLRQRNVGWRIDYVLASSALATRAVGCTSSREFGTSDHAPVLASFL
jgi:exodeoxyribonuclease-3